MPSWDSSEVCGSVCLNFKFVHLSWISDAAAGRIEPGPFSLHVPRERHKICARVSLYWWCGNLPPVQLGIQGYILYIYKYIRGYIPVTLLHAVLPLHTFRKNEKLGLSCTVNVSMYTCNLCDEIFLQKF